VTLTCKDFECSCILFGKDKIWIHPQEISVFLVLSHDLCFIPEPCGWRLCCQNCYRDLNYGQKVNFWFKLEIWGDLGESWKLFQLDWLVLKGGLGLDYALSSKFSSYNIFI